MPLQEGPHLLGAPQLRPWGVRVPRVAIGAHRGTDGGGARHRRLRITVPFEPWKVHATGLGAWRGGSWRTDCGLDGMKTRTNKKGWDAVGHFTRSRYLG